MARVVGWSGGASDGALSKSPFCDMAHCCFFLLFWLFRRGMQLNCLSILRLWILYLNFGVNWFEYLHTVSTDIRLRELVPKKLMESKNRFHVLSICAAVCFPVWGNWNSSKQRYKALFLAVYARSLSHLLFYIRGKKKTQAHRDYQENPSPLSWEFLCT